MLSMKYIFQRLWYVLTVNCALQILHMRTTTALLPYILRKIIYERDCLVSRHCYTLPNNEGFVMALREFQIPEYPLESGVVRASLLGPNGIVCRAVDESHCRLMVYMCLDPRGLLPSSAINMLAVRTPNDFYKRLGAFCRDGTI
jgi:hypothetical protein